MDWKARKAEYLAKLRDPRWQKVRLEILQRDEWRCQSCDDDSATLHVHHKWYGGGDRDPWDYPHASLITLCEACHERETYELSCASADLVQVIKQCGSDASGFAALIAAFRFCAGDSCNSAFREWDVLAFGIKELFWAASHGHVAWTELREQVIADRRREAEYERQQTEGRTPQ